MREHRRAWEIARFLAFYSVAPHDTKGKVKNPSDLLKFPWEESPKTDWIPNPELTDEQWEKVAVEAAKFFA